MAEFVLKNFGFEKIIFIPAYKPPHKDYDLEMSYHRLNMVKLATEYNKNFEVSDIEFQRDTKSYTYLTILELYKKYNPNGKISMIIGTDALKKIETWYETDKLKNLVDFIVFIRENEHVNLDWLKEKGYNFQTADMPFEDISSTKIREKGELKNVPPKVKEYIEKNGLYKN